MMYYPKDDIIFEFKELTPHLRRRYRQRVKHNFNRILKQLREFKNKHGSVKSLIADRPDLYFKYTKLCDKLEKVNCKLNLIDQILIELNAKVFRYNDGRVVPYGSMDYIILSQNSSRQ